MYVCVLVCKSVRRCVGIINVYVVECVFVFYPWDPLLHPINRQGCVSSYIDNRQALVRVCVVLMLAIISTFFCIFSVAVT